MEATPAVTRSSRRWWDMVKRNRWVFAKEAHLTVEDIALMAVIQFLAPLDVVKEVAESVVVEDTAGAEAAAMRVDQEVWEAFRESQRYVGYGPARVDPPFTTKLAGRKRKRRPKKSGGVSWKWGEV